MKIDTTRFGTIEIDNEKVINFVRGILGFPYDKRYALLPHRENSPFFWLQSLDSPELAFIVINPSLIVSDYSFEVSDDIEKSLELESPEQAESLVIVTIRRNEIDKDKKIEMTANLLGPIVINVEKRLACQVVLDPNKYPVRYEFN